MILIVALGQASSQAVQPVQACSLFSSCSITTSPRNRSGSNCLVSGYCCVIFSFRWCNAYLPVSFIPVSSDLTPLKTSCMYFIMNISVTDILPLRGNDHSQFLFDATKQFLLSSEQNPDFDTYRESACLPAKAGRNGSPIKELQLGK